MEKRVESPGESGEWAKGLCRREPRVSEELARRAERRRRGWCGWADGSGGPDHVRPYQFSSVAQSCPTLCNPMNRSMPGLPVHHQLPESTQTCVLWVGSAIQPSHPLSSPSRPAPTLLLYNFGIIKCGKLKEQLIQKLLAGTSMQSIGWLCAPSAGATGLIPGWGRSHMLHGVAK